MRPFCFKARDSVGSAPGTKNGSSGLNPRARIGRFRRVSGFFQSIKPQCTGEIPATSGSARVWIRRRRGKSAMRTELVDLGLIRTRSASNIRWMVTLASKRPSRNPSCMNIRIPAKLIPARATSNRTGWRVSNIHDSGMRRRCQKRCITPPGSERSPSDQPDGPPVAGIQHPAPHQPRSPGHPHHRWDRSTTHHVVAQAD